MMARCDCPEMLWADPDGKVRSHTHPWHDCAYVAARVALIDRAERLATYPDAPGDERRLHSDVFMREMDRLWAAEAAR
jgi:hypothetical protein